VTSSGSGGRWLVKKMVAECRYIRAGNWMQGEWCGGAGFKSDINYYSAGAWCKWRVKVQDAGVQVSESVKLYYSYRIYKSDILFIQK